MAPEEKYYFDEYGTSYPVCGNCLYAMESAGKIDCIKCNAYRDYDSCKCLDYKFKQRLPKRDFNITEEEQIEKLEEE